MTARIERLGQLCSSNVWRVILDDGRAVMDGETYAVCEAVAHAINHPDAWEPTEAYEIADALKEGQ